MFSIYFAPKWFRSGGLDFTMLLSGIGSWDSWNAVQGRFLLPR